MVTAGHGLEEFENSLLEELGLVQSMKAAGQTIAEHCCLPQAAQNCRNELRCKVLGNFVGLCCNIVLELINQGVLL